MRSLALALGSLVVLAGCGGDSPAVPDATVDGASSDATVDAGRCGADLFLTGEFLDFDWTPANAVGVAGAVWTVTGDPSRTSTTAPNGRVELCVPRGGRVRIDVDSPAAPQPPQTEPYLDGIYVADPSIFTGDRIFSVRGATVPQLQALFDGKGDPTIDPDAAHLLVEVQGGSADDVMLTGATSEPRRLYIPDGATSQYMLFVNIDSGAAGTTGTVTLTGAMGAGEVPLRGRTWTMTTIVAP